MITRLSIFTLILFLTILTELKSQNLEDSLLVNKIEFLNLEGEFKANGSIYYDKDSLKFGILQYEVCAFFAMVPFKQAAFVKDSLIAIHYLKSDIIEIYYSNQHSFINTNSTYTLMNFLKENTINGKIVEQEKLKCNGEKPKVYCQMIHNSRGKIRLKKKC